MATPRICSIPDCGKPAPSDRKGWCRPHYRRWQRHGDPLGGRETMDGEPLRYFREAVLTYDGNDCLPWPYARSADGYGRLHLDGRTNNVNRLVCMEEHGPPPTPEHEAAHSCGKGDEACCTKRHLSWKTPVQNAADKLIHGTHNRGGRRTKS